MTVDIQTVKVPAAVWREQAELILVAYGADPDEAAIQADACLQGRPRGRPGQGMHGIARYGEMLQTCGSRSLAEFELLVNTPALALVDSHAEFGSTLYADPSNHDVGHMRIAINIECILPYDSCLERMRTLCDELKASELAADPDEVLLPSELKQRRTQRRLAEAVDFDAQGMITLCELF